MRYSLQTKLLDNDNYTIYNPLSTDWSKFRWSQGYYKHYLSHEEIYKFYLVSLTYFGTTEYTDLILLLNNVSYDFDLYPGAEMWIPKLDELQKFIRDNQKNG